MSIPATGALGIMTCPGGACSGIASVVCGGGVGGGQSLKNLLNIATLGSNMSNFHGSTYGDLTVAPLTICGISNAGAVTSVLACSYSPNTFSTSTACSWLHPAAPSAPSIGGTSQNITVDANAGAARAGTVCYIPSHCGSIQTLTINQLVGTTSISVTCTLGHCAGYLSPTPSGSDCYCATIRVCMCKPALTGTGCIHLLCNGVTICCVAMGGTAAFNCAATWGPLVVRAAGPATCVCMCTVNNATGGRSCLCLCAITNIVGSFAVGSGACVYV